MTDKERIEMLEEAKEEISKRTHCLFICPIINVLLRDKGILGKAFIVFPELEKYKPAKPVGNFAWWMEDVKEPRIKVLNSMITEIKAKSNV